MLTSIFIYILSFILGMIGNIMTTIASGWSIWPPALLSGLTYFFQRLMDFNIIFPIDTLLTCIKFYISFDIIYFSVRLLLKLFNWIRGSGGIEI